MLEIRDDSSMNQKNKKNPRKNLKMKPEPDHCGSYNPRKKTNRTKSLRYR